MNRLVTIVVVAAVIVVGLYLGYTWIFPTGTLRYRMTVDVEADGQVYSGSSVIEARYELLPQILSSSRVTGRLKGEAVIVNVLGRDRLFALMTGPKFRNNTGYDANPQGTVVRAFFNTSLGGLPTATIRKMSQMELHAEVNPADWPMFVRFSDLNDPESVEQLEPNTLGPTFGRGARVLRISLATTNEPLTQQIKQTLPFLEQLRERDRQFSTMRRGDPFRVTSSMFQRGFR